MVEMALLAPWLFFVFAGVFDCGWYCSALISVQNAARVAVLHSSATGSAAGDSAGACTYALAELRALPNTRSLTDCSTLPLRLTATYAVGPDGGPSSVVAVTYQTDQLIPIPGLMGRLTVTRTAQMRIKDPML